MCSSKWRSRLTHHLRPADTLARLGGDEFVLVAEGVADELAAISLANRIIEDGRTPFRVEGEDIICTISVGLVCTTDGQRNAEELLSEADLALYRAKEHGRDRAALFDEELRITAVDRLVTERMVRRALDERRIVVEYQPIVNLKSGRPVSAEALVRIGGIGNGLQLPASFLGVAEETGLLIAIDEVGTGRRRKASCRLAYPAEGDQLRRCSRQRHRAPPRRPTVPQRR